MGGTTEGPRASSGCHLGPHPGPLILTQRAAVGVRGFSALQLQSSWVCVSEVLAPTEDMHVGGWRAEEPSRVPLAGIVGKGRGREIEIGRETPGGVR